MIGTILLASDGSEYALRAAKAASEFARRFKARLLMVHVFEIPAVPVIGTEVGGWIPLPIEPPPKEVRDSVVASTRSVIDPDLAVEDIQEIGYPAPAILRIAEDKEADLIILGSRGLGAVERFLLGSVSDNVLHHAHCSVLIVR